MTERRTSHTSPSSGDLFTDVPAPARSTEQRGAKRRRQAERDRALTNQARSLVLLQPIFWIEQNRYRLGGDEALFESVDPKVLALAAFDFISVQMVVGLGARHDDVIDHLCGQAWRMSAELPEEKAERISEYVLDTLTNGRERHREFVVPYFELSEGQWRERRFRLVHYEQAADGQLRYSLTPEGITAYLSMLDVDPALMQQAEELLIGKMVEKGSFEDAIFLAERARTRTIEYQTRLERTLRRYESYPDAVGYDEISSQLQHSLDHVCEREREEGQLLSAVNNRDTSSLDEDQRELLADLRDLLQECRRRHANLQSDLMDAPDRFLDAQNRAFRLRDSSRLSNLEPEVLLPMLEEKLGPISQAAEAMHTAMNRPITPSIFDPVILLEGIADLSEQGEGADHRPQDTDLEALAIDAEAFPNEMQERMTRFINERIAEAGELNFSALLRNATEQGLSEQERRCIAYHIISAFSPQSDAADTHAQVAGRFSSDLLSGVELVIRRREDDHGDQ